MSDATHPLSLAECRAALDFVGSLGENSTLQSKAEMAAASRFVASLGLPSHHDAQKNWDTAKCLYRVLSSTEPGDRVLDVGASRRSVILDWLEQLGYRELYACDLRETQDAFKDSVIQFSVQDLSKTDYPDGHFAGVTSVSVIEHGVDLDSYLCEMARVLRPGGWLLTSTDYWSEAIDCSGIYPYGPDMPAMKVFRPDEIETLCASAAKHGLALESPLGLATAERAVQWERVNREYTFVFFALRRI